MWVNKEDTHWRKPWNSATSNIQWAHNHFLFLSDLSFFSCLSVRARVEVSGLGIASFPVPENITWEWGWEKTCKEILWRILSESKSLYNSKLGYFAEYSLNGALVHWSIYITCSAIIFSTKTLWFFSLSSGINITGLARYHQNMSIMPPSLLYLLFVRGVLFLFVFNSNLYY